MGAKIGAFRIGVWTVDPDLGRISSDSGSISLRPLVMELLLFLAHRSGRVVSTQELLEQLWAGKVVTDGTVYNTVAELRSALSSLGDSRTFIETIPKKGYRLVAPIEPIVVTKQAIQSTMPTEPRFMRQEMLGGAALVLTLATILLIVAWILGHEQSDSTGGEPASRSAYPLRRFTVELPQEILTSQSRVRPTLISRDGRHLVFSGEADSKSPIHYRPIEALQVTPIRGTESSSGVIALSPDGLWIAFLDLEDGILKKVRISGGVAIELCDPGGKIWSMAWGSNGTIVYASSAYPGLMQISAAGGQPSQLTKPQSGVFHKQPNFTGSGTGLFFTIGDRGSTVRDGDKVAYLSLESGQQTVVTHGASPQSVADNILVYFRDHALWAVGFDSALPSAAGESIPIVDDVQYEDFAHYSLSDDGTLVYMIDVNLQRRLLVWVDRVGNESRLPIEPMPYMMPRVSPEGDRIAIVIEDRTGADLWVFSISREILTRLTNDDSREANPVWSRDGSFIVYSSKRVDNLFRVATDGTSAVERLTYSDKYQFAYSISPDDRKILFAEGNSNALPSDLAVLTLESSDEPEIIMDTEFKNFQPALSPDGRWLAYVSDKSGLPEVYLRPFPDLSGSEMQISDRGGIHPRWNQSGLEFVYQSPTHLMSVEFAQQPQARVARPKPILRLADYVSYDLGNFDVAPDGSKFLLVKPTTAGDYTSYRVVIVQNWVANLTPPLAPN